MMDNKQFLEGGRIINTHGIKGEVKIIPWADSAEFLCDLDTLYIDGKPMAVRNARPHKGNAIVLLEGVDDMNAAMLLKNKVVCLHRDDVELDEDAFFLADIIGLDVIDENGVKLGVLDDILSPSLQDVYVVKGEREIMSPVVPEFILETNVEEGYIKVRLIEGM